MNALDTLSEVAAKSEAQANYAQAPTPTPGIYAERDRVLADPTSNMNLTERVMTHDQRIRSLEMQNKEFRQAIEVLVGKLQSQLGLML